MPTGQSGQIQQKGSPQEFISQHLCILLFYCEKVPVSLVSRWVMKNIVLYLKHKAHARTHSSTTREWRSFSPLYPFSFSLLYPSPSLRLYPSVSLAPCSSLPLSSSCPPHPPPLLITPLCSPLSLSSPFAPSHASPLKAPEISPFSLLFFSLSNLSLSLSSWSLLVFLACSSLVAPGVPHIVFPF